jgi:hypothetical protein
METVADTEPAGTVTLVLAAASLDAVTRSPAGAGPFSVTVAVTGPGV